MDDSNSQDVTKGHESIDRKSSDFDRRDLMKLGMGAGIAVAALAAPQGVAAQRGGPQLEPIPPTSPLAPRNHNGFQIWPDIRESQEVSATTQIGYTVYSGAGWVNNSGRAFGNGPMDECSRRIVEFVDSYSASKMTPKLIETLNYLLMDTMGVIMGSGFESEPARINARLSQQRPGPCTMFGYGIKTSYEMAAFANAAMIRHADFNPAAHNNEMFGGVLAAAEDLHASGPDTQAAMVIAYEVIQAIGNTGLGNYDPSGWDGPYHCAGVAMAAGKLMKLNQDQLANALSLALVPHMPMYVCHIGTQSMWKGTHSSEQVRNGLWAACLAREGMTGPHMPFEARDGLIAHIGPFTRDLRFPASPDGRMSIETLHVNGGSYKRFATEGNNTTFHNTIAPAIIAWTTPEEIDQIDVQFHYGGWQEICDPLKWDPRNRETADHSMPYNVARRLIDKEIYMDSFTKEKYMDPKCRELMAKIIARPNVDNEDIFTVRKKSGETKVFKGGVSTPMSHDELTAKYYKLCDFAHIDKAQADKIRQTWMNLQDTKDINDAIQTVAKFGSPRPLSDRTPARIS